MGPQVVDYKITANRLGIGADGFKLELCSDSVVERHHSTPRSLHSSRSAPNCTHHQPISSELFLAQAISINISRNTRVTPR
jgi:hypothetical protein